MTIHRSPKDAMHPYTRLANMAMQDTRLRWQTRGVLGYLLTLPDDWTIRIRHIAKQSDHDGLGAVQAAFQDMKAHGYAALVVCREEGGRVYGKTWEVWEDPTAVLPPAAPEAADDRQATFPTVGESAHILFTEEETKEEETAVFSCSPEEDAEEETAREPGPVAVLPPSQPPLPDEDMLWTLFQAQPPERQEALIQQARQRLDPRCLRFCKDLWAPVKAEILNILAEECAWMLAGAGQPDGGEG